MRRYGLIGRPLGHSASARYFASKFSREAITDAEYCLYELPAIEALGELLPSDIDGFNVTIPYKREIMPLLDEISPEAQAVGAVNCVKCSAGRRVGYNTDVVGIRRSLDRLLGAENAPKNPAETTSNCAENTPNNPSQSAIKALVLGTGGASQAVQYVLRERGIDYLVVSRDRVRGDLVYEDVTAEVVAEYRLIINATPVGMYPHTAEAPELPYGSLSERNLLFDTIYNPAQTEFLLRGERAGAQTINGVAMFESQAEASWEIWNW